MTGRSKGNYSEKADEGLLEHVTIDWLLKRVPVKWWIWAAGILLSTLALGMTFGKAISKYNEFAHNTAEQLPETSSLKESDIPAEEKWVNLKLNKNKEVIQGSTEHTNGVVHTVSKDSLFVPNNPFPEPFQSYRIGTKASTLLESFPDNSKLTWSGLRIELAGGPFQTAVFKLNQDRIDPEVVEAVFVIRQTAEAKAEVRRQVLGAFHIFTHEQSRVRNEFYWDDMSGYELSLDEWFYVVK